MLPLLPLLQTGWVIPGPTSQNRSYKGRASGAGGAQPPAVMMMSSDPPAARPRQGGGQARNLKIQFCGEVGSRACVRAFDRRSVYEVHHRAARRGGGEEEEEGGGASQSLCCSRFLCPPPTRELPGEPVATCQGKKVVRLPSLSISLKDVGGILFAAPPSLTPTPHFSLLSHS